MRIPKVRYGFSSCVRYSKIKRRRCVAFLELRLYSEHLNLLSLNKFLRTSDY